MNHKVCARLFVERFLIDLGVEASSEFRDDLENAVEDLLEEEIATAIEEADSKSSALVWRKSPKRLPTASTKLSLVPDNEVEHVPNAECIPH